MTNTKEIRIDELVLTIEDIENAEQIAENEETCTECGDPIFPGERAYCFDGEWYSANCIEAAIKRANDLEDPVFENPYRDDVSFFMNCIAF